MYIVHCSAHISSDSFNFDCFQFRFVQKVFHSFSILFTSLNQICVCSKKIICQHIFDNVRETRSAVSNHLNLTWGHLVNFSPLCVFKYFFKFSETISAISNHFRGPRVQDWSSTSQMATYLPFQARSNILLLLSLRSKMN